MYNIYMYNNILCMYLFIFLYIVNVNLTYNTCRYITLYHIVLYIIFFKSVFDTTAKFQISVFVERMTILKSECLDCDCICFRCMRTDVLILLGLESVLSVFWNTIPSGPK